MVYKRQELLWSNGKSDANSDAEVGTMFGVCESESPIRATARPKSRPTDPAVRRFDGLKSQPSDELADCPTVGPHHRLADCSKRLSDTPTACPSDKASRQSAYPF